MGYHLALVVIGLSFTLVWSSAGLAKSAELLGTAYSADNHAGPLFSFRAWEEDGTAGRTVRSKFVSPDGKLLVSEEVLFEKGKLKSYSIQQAQIGEDDLLDVGPDRITFHVTKDGKTSVSSESLPANLLIGPTVVDFMRAHWDRLVSGGSEDVRFAVPSREETVGFQLSKDSEETENGKPTVTIEMRPTSLFVRLAVKPLYFKFDKESRDILSIQGRTLPKKAVGDRWEDQDPLIEYHREP